ncbi:MAG: hypothetical protein QOE99_2885 [Actinomycetota bacterium]|jgi:hypothetical protein|nr:hypothetical protein [Actinomycetota bacterium]
MPPGPDGLAVVRELQDQAGLRMIVYTNYKDAKIAAQVERLGATYLLKGDLRSLRSVVAAAAEG